MQKQNLILIYIISLLSFSCKNVKNELLFNKDFDEVSTVAKVQNLPFCIVLVNSSSDLSKGYVDNLQKEYKALQEKAIYNVVDIVQPGNSWYLKWLLPVSLPLTCVFSPNGTLIDIIPGTSKETFLYSDEVMEKQKISDFHWVNQFNMDKNKVIPLLNSLLLKKNNITKNINSSDKINDAVDSLNYPYSAYLRLKTALKANDTLASKKNAKLLLELENPGDFETYKQEFIEAKKTLDANFDIKTEANIRVENANINIENSRVTKSTPINIKIYNDGKKTLRIRKINMSCSCLNLVGPDSNIVVEGKKSHVAKFYFTPETPGIISRDIFINSNAINNSILYINLKANVKK